MNMIQKNKTVYMNSGGAKGSDTVWERESLKYGIKVRAFTYKTPYHLSTNRVEISDVDFNEGVDRIKIANRRLKRRLNPKYLNLLSRNWAQVKNSEEIYAIGWVIKPGGVDRQGYINKSNYEVVSGGTGWAVQMAIDSGKVVYVFHQDECVWFKWSPIIEKFKPVDCPIISVNSFAGIGTREINNSGEVAIIDILKNSFNSNNS